MTDEQTPIDREMQTLLRQRNELADQLAEAKATIDQLRKQLAAMQGELGS